MEFETLTNLIVEKYHSIDESAHREAMELESNLRLLENFSSFYEILANISYIAGKKEYSSGDIKEDIMSFIYWTIEFRQWHGDTFDTDHSDLVKMIEGFLKSKIIQEAI